MTKSIIRYSYFYQNKPKCEHEIKVYVNQNYSSHGFNYISLQVLYKCCLFTEGVQNYSSTRMKSMKGNSYLNMLQLWLLPQQGIEGLIFQHDGAPSLCHLDIRNELNTRFPRRWIGRVGREDFEFLTWPPRSSDLTPCDFFLWGFVKQQVYRPPYNLSSYHRGSSCPHQRGHCTSGWSNVTTCMAGN